MKDYRLTAPPRVAAVGFGPGRGGSRLPAYQGSPWTAMGGPAPPTSSSNPISAAVAGALGQASNGLQIALGVALVGAALLLVISQTSAGAAAGSAGKGAARLGLRAVPIVGALA